MGGGRVGPGQGVAACGTAATHRVCPGPVGRPYGPEMPGRKDAGRARRLSLGGGAGAARLSATARPGGRPQRE